MKTGFIFVRAALLTGFFVSSPTAAMAQTAEQVSSGKDILAKPPVAADRAKALAIALTAEV